MWQFLRRKIKKQSLSAAESRTSTVKSWMKFSEKIHTCRKFIPAIHARHLRCSACTRPRENTSTSAIRRISCGTRSWSAAQSSRWLGTRWETNALAASSVFQSVRRNASTSPASRPSSTSTSACTAADARRRVREERFAKEGSSPLILATDFMGIVIR